MLTATFRDGNLYDLNYFDEVKSDAYPLVQLRKDERLLKGFEWQPEKRPRGPEDVTSYVPRESERSRYERIKRPAFKETEAYFPGYMASVEKELRLARLKKQEQREKRRLEEEMKQEEQVEQVKEETQDQIIQEDKKEQVTEQKPVLPAESPAQADTLVLEKEQIDSLLAGNTIEALKARLPVDPKAEIKARQKAERDARKAEKDKARQAKISKKEAKWAALDARDAEKAAKKEAKRQEKQRIKMEKMLKARAEREAKEQKIFDRYKEKYEKKKSKL